MGERLRAWSLDASISPQGLQRAGRPNKSQMQEAIGKVPIEPLNQILPQKHRNKNGICVCVCVVEMGGVQSTSKHQKGILVQYDDANRSCNTILFKSNMVSGECDSSLQSPSNGHLHLGDQVCCRRRHQQEQPLPLHRSQALVTKYLNVLTSSSYFHMSSGST